MPGKFFSLFVLMALTIPVSALAGAEKGAAVYHALRLETGFGMQDDSAGIADWDLNGWVGTDEDKLWIRSEGERENGITTTAEFWAMYSRNIEMFWDVQLGIRHDTQPGALTYGVVGLEGLAPYFFETEAHLFISEDGDVSVRLRQENDFLLTQKLILQPYAEANLFAKDVPELGIGSGLADGEIGIQARYEVTRGFAPYLDIRYERKFGETSSIAKNGGESSESTVGTVGLRFLF
jgi:copper resistance protein B